MNIRHMLIAVITAITVSTNLTSCNNEKVRYEAQFLALFDTVTQIVAYSSDKEEFNRYAQLIYDSLQEYHELFDIYNDYDGINNIKTINDNAGIAPVRVDQRIIDLLIFSKQQYSLSNGAMNIAFGSVLKIWHDYRERGIQDFQNPSLPPLSKLQEAKNHTDINKIIIDEENSTVFLEDSKMSLDVGAVGKGYAVERVSSLAEQSGFTSALINVGGNVRAIGDKGNGEKSWNVGIKNPHKQGGKDTLLTLYLKDLSLVTSGDYQRKYTVDGKEYHHIIDTETLFPSDYFSAVTVVCKDSGLADALSTAIYNVSFEKGLKLIESIDGAEALWVFKNGNTEYSTGLKKEITKYP